MGNSGIVTNIYLRLIFGFWSIAIGLLTLKLYFCRHKNNNWSMFYKKIFESQKYTKAELGFKKILLFLQERVVLILGWLGVIAGIIAICFGFKPRIV